MLHMMVPVHCAGAELTAHALLRELVRRGHNVDVVLSQHHDGIPEPYTVDGIEVHPHRGKDDPFRWLDDPERRPHVIVTHLENAPRATILGGLRKIPVVQLLHNTFPATHNALLRSPALVTVNSDWMAADVAEQWRAKQGDRPMPRMVRVHPPVDPKEYTTTPGRQITLVNVSVDKGSGVFYALAERFPQLTFLGVGGAYFEQDRRTRTNVRWVDHMPHTEMRDRVYHRTRVMLMPSVYESYGRVAVEAACSGIPTIAHPTPGLRESLGDAGVFVHRDDIDGWAAELRRLTAPRGGWNAASRAATRRARELAATAELDQWATTVEEVATSGAARVS